MRTLCSLLLSSMYFATYRVMLQTAPHRKFSTRLLNLCLRFSVLFSVAMDPLNTTKERLLRVAGKLLSLADQST